MCMMVHVPPVTRDNHSNSSHDKNGDSNHNEKIYSYFSYSSSSLLVLVHTNDKKLGMDSSEAVTNSSKEMRR